MMFLSNSLLDFLLFAEKELSLQMKKNRTDAASIIRKSDGIVVNRV